MLPKMNDLIERYNTHKQWTDDDYNMAKNAWPKSFAEKMDWMDWRSTLVEFLKSQSVRNRVPLSYVVRYNETTITRPSANFLDDYVNSTLLTGRYFF